MAASWLDTFLFLFLAIQLLAGFRQGLVQTLTGLVGFAVVLAAVFVGAPALAERVASVFHQPPAVMTLAGAVVLGMFASALVATASRGLRERLARDPRWGLPDRWLGLGAGALKGVLGATLLAWGYVSLLGPLPPHTPLGQALIAKAGPSIERVTSQVQARFPAIVLGPEGWEILPGAPPSSPKVPVTRLEREMLAMVNRSRAQAHLKPLVWDDRLAAIAMEHSRDMLSRNYFSHPDPEGRDAGYRAAKAHIPYVMLGENLAFAPNLNIAEDGLMKSPGHRANILRPGFRRLGIGIVRVPAGAHYLPSLEGKRLPSISTRGYLIVTQDFDR